MSDTPRTDAVHFEATPESEDLEETMTVVDVEHARTLERDIAAMTRERNEAQADEQMATHLKCELEDQLTASRRTVAELTAAVAVKDAALEAALNHVHLLDDGKTWNRAVEFKELITKALATTPSTVLEPVLEALRFYATGFQNCGKDGFQPRHCLRNDHGQRAVQALALLGADTEAGA